MKHRILHNDKRIHWIAAGLALSLFTFSNVTSAVAQAGDTFSLPAPAQAFLDNAQKIQRLPMDQLTQFDNGHGVIIASPTSTASADSSLGRGAARWLEWNLGGLPVFGKNAIWYSYVESISYLQRHKINSDSEAAEILSINTGATNVAIGSLTGDKNHLSLSYQWRKFPGNQLMGKAVNISGSPKEIVKQLPRLAEKLAAQLNVKSTFKAPAETVAQLQELGNLPSFPQTDLPDAAIVSLKQLASVSNPARMMYLSFLNDSNYNGLYPSSRARQEWKKVAEDLLAANPANTLAWQYVAENNNGNLWGNEAKLIALGKKYPHNYLLNYALTKMYGGQDKMQERRDFSQLTLRCNRQNPRAWTQLADTIYYEADSVRHGCYWSSMNIDQQTFVSDRYEECIPLLETAAKIPHHSASTWADISTVATFAGDDDLIQSAMQKALEADPFSQEALSWALQVYQPKWGGSPDELLPVVKRIVANPVMYVRLFKSVNQAIAASGFPKGMKASQQEVKQVLETWLKEHPHDYAARSNYGLILWQLKDPPGMKAQGEILIKERPNDSVGYSMRAGRFYGLQQYKYASEYYQKALQYDPDNPTLHYDLAETYHLRGQNLGEKTLFPQARDEYEKSLQENANFTASYDRLGDLYIYVFNDPQKAVDFYSKAVSLSLGSGLYWANLGHAQFLLGKKKLALKDGIHARQMGYNGQHPLWNELKSMVNEE
jgi:tetratricopeptide (TPR) repeat protein